MKIEAGQVAVVTGGASGIGFGLAEALGRRGVAVVIADVQGAAAERAASDLSARGVATLAVTVDVSDPEAVDALASATLERFGRVDLVCNNAGVVCRPAPMWEQTPRTWQWVIDVALLGVVYGVRSFAPVLLCQGSGHFLNTASVGGLMPLPMLTPYNAAKHAVVGLTESLNIELRGVAPGVGASALCPGQVETALGETSLANRPEGAEAPRAAGNDAPVERRGAVMTPAEVALVALDGVEHDRVHILTHLERTDGVRARVDALLADLAP